MEFIREARARRYDADPMTGLRGLERPMEDQLLRLERLLSEFEPTVDALVRPVIECIRHKEWGRARRHALEFLASTPQDTLNERLLEYQLRRDPSWESSDDLLLEVPQLTKLRVLVRSLGLSRP